MPVSESYFHKEKKRRHFYLDSRLQTIQCHFSSQAAIQQVEYEITCSHSNSWYQGIQIDLLRMPRLKQKGSECNTASLSYTGILYSPKGVVFSKCSYPKVSDAEHSY